MVEKEFENIWKRLHIEAWCIGPHILIYIYLSIWEPPRNRLNRNKVYKLLKLVVTGVERPIIYSKAKRKESWSKGSKKAKTQAASKPGLANFYQDLHNYDQIIKFWCGL